MATLTAIAAARTGVTLSPVAAAGGGDQFLNTGREVLYVKNGSGGSITLTLAPAGTPNGLALATYTVTIAAGAERIIGPFDTSLFNNASGMVTITYSGVTTLTVAVIRVP
jgi:hypothetical protein